MSLIITSVKVDEEPGHDRVRVWNRGGLAGELVVTKGDGQRIAERLQPATYTGTYLCVDCSDALLKTDIDRCVECVGKEGSR